MKIKAIKYKKAYENLIAYKISKWMWEDIFKGCFDVLKSDTTYNDNSVIRSALEKGLIYYQDNAFYSKSGRFSNKVALELEKIGATYSKYRKAYLINKSNIPAEILWAIDTIKAQTAAKVLLLQGYLSRTIDNLTKTDKSIIVKTAVEAIMQDLQKRVYKNFSEKKIELITPKLTDFKQSEIAKNYTNNLDFWIKNWTEDEIIKMRSAVGKMAIDGKSLVDIEQYLTAQFGVSKRHAQFLARNETAIATTSYLSAKYQEEGMRSFRWVVNLDNRERPWHRKLGTTGPDGKGNIYRFDDPPIINEKTGQKGLPGYDYNCRCSFIPVLDKEWLENRKKLFKANNSLTARIKKFFKV